MAKFGRNFISGLRNWVERYQITIINSSVTVLLIGIVIFVLLSRASILQKETSEESMINLSGMAAYEIQSYYSTYFDITRTIAKTMSNYTTIEITQRRAFINDLMLSILSSNRSLMSVYTLWRPNSLDGMDAKYANTKGNDETGQFISGFTREEGWIEQRIFPENRYLLGINYSDLHLLNGIVTQPVAKIFGMRDTWVVDFQVPILIDNTHVIGVIGMTINLAQLQFLVEPLKPYGTGNTMVVSSNGTVFAASNARLRGASFQTSNIPDPLFSGSSSRKIFGIILDSLQEREPAAYKTKDILLVSYPLKNVDLLSGSNSSNEINVVPWAVVTTVPMSTILAPINTLLRFSILFIAGAGILAMLTVFLTSNSLTRRTRVLQYDLERATIMQDNLKYGLFMMDQKHVIQGAYSKALEKILSVSNLQGKDFISLLSSSLKASEQSGLSDYFEMIFKETFDKEMLESVNPINIFPYISNETGEPKSLRTSFTMINRGRGSVYILGTLEDITAEKELEKQLLKAENQKEKEMKSLFQVIQLNPRVLSDFIEDTEYEFDQINEKLKNKTHFHREVLVEIYQSIHAVKSNALILNLENFGNRLHKLETSVKELGEKYEDFVPFDDFLDIVLEIDEVMKEKDQLKAAVSRIHNFKNLSGELPGQVKEQERYVLVETLTQTCNKAMEALNKQVVFVVEAIDEEVLDYGPRRVIKEVLTQLVRNAVYHGIELPEERKSQGKEAEGEIRLSIRYIDNSIVIKLSDNGQGLDFDRIRQTAEAFNLFSNPEEADDRNFLQQIIFSPGFSTLETADLYAGRGMGLSLVKERLQQIQGDIEISTVPGEGTTFTISIPLVIPAAADAS